MTAEEQKLTSKVESVELQYMILRKSNKGLNEKKS